MAYPFSLPQNFKIVEAITPQVGAAITSDYVSLKYAHKAWVIVMIQQAAVNNVAITIEQSPLVSGVGHIPIVNAVPIWVCLRAEASDALIEQAAAVGYTTSADQWHKIVIFEIDPALFTDGYDVLSVVTAASNAGNITSALFVLASRYQQDTPPTVIID